MSRLVRRFGIGLISVVMVCAAFAVPSSADSNSGPGLAAGSLSAGDTHSCALADGGTVLCWGANGDGQSGHAGASTHVPSAVVGLASAQEVSSAGSHSCAVLDGGTVSCWGYNDDGQVGHAGASTHVPSVVVGVSGAIGVSAGDYHSCAVLDGGTVSCWGNNDDGQVGHAGASTYVPSVVVGVSGAVAVSGGTEHSCALLGNGTVSCWGANGDGQAGHAGASSHVPSVVVGVSGAVGLSVSNIHSCAVLDGGSVLCWGYNGSGQAGHAGGAVSSTYVPSVVVGLSGATAVSVGERHSCALSDGGTVLCWGENGDGQAGHAGADNHVPSAVSGVADAVAVSAGRYHSCALSGGGTVTCWGYNADGQSGHNGSSTHVVLEVVGVLAAIPTPIPIPTAVPPTATPTPQPTATPTPHVPSGTSNSYVIANLEELEAGPGEIRVHGWAYDPDLPSKDLVVHVYAFFDGVGDPVALGTPVVRAADFRPDINRAFDIEGDHGFNRSLKIRNGNHRVCVYSLSVDGAGNLDDLNRLIGCRYVTVTDEALPRGAFDIAAQTGTSLKVSGWAYDLDRENDSIDIQVFLDGAFFKTITANTSRPDVNKIVQISGDHGFNSTFTVPAGGHTVCLYAIGVDPNGAADGENVLLNVIDKPDCRTTTG